LGELVPPDVHVQLALPVEEDLGKPSVKVAVGLP
jgi:hypothetical protein